MDLNHEKPDLGEQMKASRNVPAARLILAASGQITAKRWFAPMAAVLVLAGLTMPAVSGIPLPTTPATPIVASATNNLLVLDGHGAIVLWQDVTANRTTIQIQGVSSGSQFRLVDALGQFVGGNHTSSPAGMVSFSVAALQKGSYTLVGSGKTPTMVHYDLSSVGSREIPALNFGTPAQSAQLTRQVADLCELAPLNGTSIGAGLWLKQVAPGACELRLAGTSGCLLENQTYCLYATLWAWSVNACPGGAIGCMHSASANMGAGPTD